MAVTTIEGPDTATVALSGSYLGISNHVEGSNCDYVTVWIDKDAVLVGDFKWTVSSGGNGDTVESQLAAGVHKTFRPGRHSTWTLDAKSDSGTPNLNIETGLIR